MRGTIIGVVAVLLTGLPGRGQASGYSARWHPEPKMGGGEARLISVAGTCASDDEHAPCLSVGCRAGGQFELLLQSTAGWEDTKAPVRAGRSNTSVSLKGYPKSVEWAGIATSGGPIELAFLEKIQNENRLSIRYSRLGFSVTLNGFAGQLAAMKKRCLRTSGWQMSVTG